MRRRRGGIISARCVVAGCGEDTLFEYQTQSEYPAKKRLADTWLCLKHAKPSEWLRPEQPRIESVLIATRLPGLPNDLFWVPDDGTTGSGFTHGPGFRAFTNDVPEGTLLRVVATMELPGREREDPVAPTVTDDGDAQSLSSSVVTTIRRLPH